MALKKKETVEITKTPTNNSNDELLLLEQKKVRALEKIANSLDALTVWFEEVNKDEWSDRLQYYLAEFHTKFIKDENSNK
jgi:hypothetical protein